MFRSLVVAVIILDCQPLLSILAMARPARVPLTPQALVVDLFVRVCRSAELERLGVTASLAPRGVRCPQRAPPPSAASRHKVRTEMSDVKMATLNGGTSRRSCFKGDVTVTMMHGGLHGGHVAWVMYRSTFAVLWSHTGETRS